MNAKDMGKKGGSAKSEAKTNAARENAKKPRGILVTAIHAKWVCVDGKTKSATFTARGAVETIEQQIKAIEWFYGHTAVSELLECSSTTHRLII